MRPLLLSLLVSCLCFLPYCSFALVYVVSNTQTGGAGSLAEAVGLALEGDTIDARGISGTILLDTTLLIDEDMVIWGPGVDQLILDGQNSVRHFFVVRFDSLYLEGVQLINGNSGSDPNSPFGGSIFNRGKLEVVNCIFENNRSITGGAIFNTSIDSLSTRTWIRNCGFYHNHADQASSYIPQSGGALAGDSRGGGEAKFWAYNSTFSGNTALNTGGAVFLIADPSGGARFEGVNCTIADNTGGLCGGIDNSVAEICFLKNSIVANNHGNAGFEDLYGTLRSRGNNLIGNDQSILWDPSPTATDIKNVDPGLGPLASSGTAFRTHFLLCGSPAIDSGDDTEANPEDLRGQPRVGISDIGAHERNEALDLAISHTDEFGLGSLRQAILLSCPGDTLYADQIHGTIHLSSSIDLEQSITIQGNPQQALLLSGDYKVRLFTIAPNIEAALSWMTLFRGKPSLFGGGAILNRGHLTLSHMTLQDNVAESGGAIANYGNLDSASLTLLNCTLSGNSSSSLDGGAIDNRPFSSGASATLLFCTIANNQATNKGGGLYNEDGGNMSVRNTLIDGNQAASGPDIFGTYHSLGHNLIGNSQDAVFGPATGDLLDQSANLDSLANYGGPTFTHRLSAGSPAIDAGSNDGAPGQDQRGLARLFNGTADIGAYEFDPATSVEASLIPEVRLFPNPSTGILHVRFQHLPQAVHLQVLDLKGAVWHSEQVDSRLILLHLDDLPKGVYVLTFSMSGRHFSKKIVLL
ncbi:MAG: T9SS type A sorting domain-containing protein [Bacteroidota bacterium]